jgi:hypothetical protein
VSKRGVEEPHTPSQAGDYECPVCGDKLSYPPESYDFCPGPLPVIGTEKKKNPA